METKEIRIEYLGYAKYQCKFSFRVGEYEFADTFEGTIRDMLDFVRTTFSHTVACEIELPLKMRCNVKLLMETWS